jgi:polyferredoxin
LDWKSNKSSQRYELLKLTYFSIWISFFDSEVYFWLMPWSRYLIYMPSIYIHGIFH